MLIPDLLPGKVFPVTRVGAKHKNFEQAYEAAGRHFEVTATGWQR
ncbi:hypothetical protein PV783_10270 [Chitinophaga sp. CC14]